MATIKPPPDAIAPGATGEAMAQASFVPQRSTKTKKKSTRVETMVVSPERHISVDSHELKVAVKNRLELEDRVLFDDLTKLMEGVANFDFFDLKQRMHTNFLPFATGAKNQVYLQRSSKNLPTTPALDTKEEDFIADVYEVLRASHFTLLTKEEWDLATSENFKLNLPMKVTWEYMDDQLLKKFWASNRQRAAIRRNLADCMADRILVFHRGVGSEKLEGLLIDQKLDLLMDYTVFYLLDKIVDPIKAILKKSKKAKKAKQIRQEVAEVAAAEAAEAAAAAEAATKKAGMSRSSSNSSISSANSDEQHLGDAAMGRYQFEGNKLIGSTHRFARTIERNTLARQCPTLVTLLKAFPQKLELQEPTFKDIVVVYRRAFPERKPPTTAINAPNKTKEERMKGILSYRNIYIKVFGETPMADVEMIFPEKTVGIKPFQLVNLIVTVITAFVTGALVLWKAGKDINMNIMWTAASLVMTRCFTVYNTAQTQRTLLQQKMTAELYDKMQDSQEGVVSVIMEEMADQQLKQMLVAYMMLIIKSRPLLQSDLDTSCEDFLYKEFDHPINYAIDDALPRLQRWGLVNRSAQGKLEALPMAEAKAVLEEAWREAYKFIGSDRALDGTTGKPVPTIDMITGNFSTFGAGIDKFKQDRAAHRAQAAADAEASKRGIMGKATANVDKAFTKLGGGLTSKLPFGGSKSHSAAASGADAGAASMTAPAHESASVQYSKGSGSSLSGRSTGGGSAALAATGSAASVAPLAVANGAAASGTTAPVTPGLAPDSAIPVASPDASPAAGPYFSSSSSAAPVAAAPVAAERVPSGGVYASEPAAAPYTANVSSKYSSGAAELPPAVSQDLGADYSAESAASVPGRKRSNSLKSFLKKIKA